MSEQISHLHVGLCLIIKLVIRLSALSTDGELFWKEKNTIVKGILKLDPKGEEKSNGLNGIACPQG